MLEKNDLDWEIKKTKIYKLVHSIAQGCQSNLDETFGDANHKVPNRIFLNQIPGERTFRQDIQERIEKNMVGRDPFGIGKVLNYHVFQEGESSVVVKLLIRKEGKDMICVLRTHSSCDRTSGEEMTNLVVVEAEAARKRNHEFKKRSQESGAEGDGIHLETIQQGEISIKGKKQPYVILKFGKNEYEINEGNKYQFYKQLGENIGIMNKVIGEGFGPIQRTESGNFIGTNTTYQLNNSTENDKKILIKNGFFEEDELNFLIYQCYETIRKDFESGTLPVRTSRDLSRCNMFAMTPRIKFFDTETFIDHPMMGLGLAIDKNIWDGTVNLEEEKPLLEEIMINAYENTGGLVNRECMDYCIFLTAIKRVARAIKSGKLQRARQMMDLSKDRPSIKKLMM